LVEDGNHNEYVIKVIYAKRDSHGCERELSVGYKNIIKDIDPSHIIKYYMHLVDAEGGYFFMQYCEGGNLDQYIEKHKDVPFSEKVFFFFFLGFY
jgi:serine/threonine protein kinase